MPDREGISATYLPIAALRAAYAAGELSPIDVVDEAFKRLVQFNPSLNAFVSTLEELAKQQAAASERAFREGRAGALSGIPLSIKDTFDVAGAVSTRGSLVYRSHVAANDSGAVRRLRAAGAVFVGKTNTAEFGQSATTENRLGDPTRNPWDIELTPGGSSGGAAASVAAGIVTAALGADGGGSLRIPGAFTGLVGFKPTFGAVPDEQGFPAMSDFCCPGPLTRCVADARAMLSVLAEREFVRGPVTPLKIALCLRPEGRPVDRAVLNAVSAVAKQLSLLGHRLEEVQPPIDGWKEIFGPLVLEEEGRLRGHLLKEQGDKLSDYEHATLIAAASVTPDIVDHSRKQHVAFQARMTSFFERFDVLVTPTTATSAFSIGTRPREIDGQLVDALWGAFPFTAAFNVAGTPAISLPCGDVANAPIGVQLVTRKGRDGILLDLAEELEEAIKFDLSPVMRQYAGQQASEPAV